MSDKQQELTQTLSDATSDVRSKLVDEWKSRTAFGKAMYPIWLVLNALTWLVLLSIIAAVILFIQIDKGFDALVNWVIPEVYKDER